MDSPSFYFDENLQALVDDHVRNFRAGNISLADDLDQVQMDSLWPHDQDQQHVNDAVTSEAHQYTYNLVCVS